MPAVSNNIGRRSFASIKQSRSRADTLSSMKVALSRNQKNGKVNPDLQRNSSVRFTIPVTKPGEDNNTLPAISDEPNSDGPASVEQLREVLNTQSTRYTKLSSYLMELIEQHAAEKAELLRRIDSMERELQKREREVKGLRWLVANMNHGEATRRSPERFRTFSKASQISVTSNPSLHTERAQSPGSLFKPASGSFDEGGGSRAICGGDNLISDIVSKDVVVFGESVNG